jgi:hypothetical protein
MNIEIKDILSFLGSVSIGAVLLDWLRFRLDKRKLENTKRQEFKEVRYKAVILLMSSALDFEKNKPMLHLHGRANLNTIEDLMEEIDTEWKNMILYANDDVMKTMREFVHSPTLENFWKTTLEMRKDLYGIKTKLQTFDFKEKSGL